MVEGGGIITQQSQIRKEKVRKYQRRVDIRSIIRSYEESPDDVRKTQLCRSTAQKLYAKLKECPPYVGTAVLRQLKTVENEKHLDKVLDEIWLFAEARRILLIA